MNQYFNYFKTSTNDRDFVFKEVLNFFNKAPLRILEIGCSRTLDFITGKSGDGYSSFFWAEYVKEHGGKLTIVDIDETAINNCKTLLSDFNDIIFIVGDGINYITEDFDLIYLDGGDNPVETLNQFNKVNRFKSSILCDDFHTKFCFVRQQNPDFKLYQVNSNHQMAFYSKLNFVESNLNLINPNIINIVHETNKIQCINKNGENIVIACFYGSNRDQEVTQWHQKVFNHFKIPINYVLCPFPGISHGQAIDLFIQNTINFVDYYILLDNDMLYLKKDFVDIIYDKIKDKETLFGGSNQSNHLSNLLGTDYNHPYIGAAGMALSKELYLKLGCSSFDTDGKNSDTGERITYACERLGYSSCMMWPSDVVGLTEEECKEYGVALKHAKSKVGCFYFGLGTTYGNDFAFHAMCQNVPRSKKLFVDKCKQILSKKV